MIINPIIKSGGLKPEIIVTAPTGSTVTVTKDSVVYTATEVSGTWTFKVLNIGQYIVTATLNGLISTATVNVDCVGQFAVSLSYGQISEYRYAGCAVNPTWDFSVSSDGLSVIVSADSYDSSAGDDRLSGGFAVNGLASGDDVEITFTCNRGGIGGEGDVIIADSNGYIWYSTSAYNEYTKYVTLRGNSVFIFVNTRYLSTTPRTLTVHSIKVNGVEIL